MTAATTFAYDPLLDLAPYIGQRQSTFRFTLYDVATNRLIRELQPYRDSAPTLTHDSARVITRQISNLFFNAQDTADLSTTGSRVKIDMLFPGREPYPIGTYLFIDQLRQRTTAGLESTATFVDSMLIVDQQITQSYSPGVFTETGVAVSLRQVDQAIADVLIGIPVTFIAAPSPFYTIGSWAAGSSRGPLLGDLSTDGDYFSPWFDNTDVLRFIRSFDPIASIPDFDYDANHVIDRDSIIFTDDLINAYNQFIVISTGSVSSTTNLPIVGRYDVPASAPHSIFNRGFAVPNIIDWQVDTIEQANAIAFTLGQQQTIFERVEFNTIPDPRHDGYNVIRFEGKNWLEIAWSLPLIEGSSMRHVARRAYT